MKWQADKQRTPRTFNLGDSVFIKLQPYVQSSVARRANHKLAFRYFGPYKICTVINPVAYEVVLGLQDTSHFSGVTATASCGARYRRFFSFAYTI
jgi:hypothetical protein